MNRVIKVVESLESYNSDINRRIRQGSLKRPDTSIVMTPEVFSRVFSPERIKLLRRIHANDIRSIYQLARELGKPYEVVFRNLKYLEGLGLVRMKSKDNRRIPCLVSGFSISMFADAEA